MCDYKNFINARQLCPGNIRFSQCDIYIGHVYYSTFTSVFDFLVNRICGFLFFSNDY